MSIIHRQSQGQNIRLSLRCYAEGRKGKWEAICLDLDLAVQGGSLEEVVNGMRSAIREYVGYVMTLPAEDRDRLLARSAPISLRLKYAFCMARTLVGGRRRGGSDGKERADFTLNAAAA